MCYADSPEYLTDSKEKFLYAMKFYNISDFMLNFSWKDQIILPLVWGILADLVIWSLSGQMKM